MKRILRNRSVHAPFRPRALCVALALAFGTPAHGNPTGAVVASGQASIVQQGSTLSVTNTPNAIINWQSFSIGAAETTRFIQQSASSAVLNRVVGVDPSVILGTLQSNGRVFLINPSGVLFGQGSRIDVAGLVASTLNVSDQDFLAGRLNFIGNAGAGSIVNSGTITTPSGGSVFLVAPNIENNGVITAPNGEIILAAGQSILLGDTGAPNVLVEVQAPESRSININEMISSGGGASIHSGLIQQNGVVRADSVGVNAAGRIVFKSSKDVTLAAGSTTSASGGAGGSVQIQAAGGTNTVRGVVATTGSVGVGGSVQLLGNQVGLAGNATVDASGATAGGTILVGGDYKGANKAVQNAAATVIESTARLTANATSIGNGGRIIVWSDVVTGVHGAISARGGIGGGNGGFLETSSKGYLEVSSIPDLVGPKGEGGTWLLDPASIRISDLTQQFVVENFDVDALFTNDGTNSPSIINASSISDRLSAGINVIVSTVSPLSEAGDITINAAIEKTGGGNATLTLRADNDINITADITSNAGALNLVLNSNADGLGGGIINIAGATLDANGGTIDAAGKIVRFATGTTTIQSIMTAGEVNFDGGTLIANGNIDTVSYFQNSGTLAGTGTVTVADQTILNGSVFMTGPGTLITRGLLEIDGQLVLDGGRVLEVNGGANWTSGGIILNTGNAAGSGSIINRAGSTFNVDFDGQAMTAPNAGTGDDGSDALFHNLGTFAKVGGDGPVTIQAFFSNSGSLHALNGEVNLQGGSQQAGSILIGNVGTLAFEGGTHELASSLVLNSTGDIRVGGSATVNAAGGLTNGGELRLAGGTLNVLNGISTGEFFQNGGMLAGAGDVTVSGQTTLSGVAYMTGPGHLITRGALTIDGQVVLDGGRVIDVQGGADWLSGPIYMNGGVETGSGSIVNRAGSVFDVQFDGQFIYAQNNGTLDDGTDAAFTNQGTFVKSAGTGGIAIQTVFHNEGALEIQSGELDLYHGGVQTGTILVAGGAVLAFEAGTHQLQNAAAISSAGVVRIGGSATVATTGVFNNGGELQITGGTLNAGDVINTATFSQSGGTLAGTGDVIVSGQSTLSGVAYMTGPGHLITRGALTIDGQVVLDGGRVIDVQGGADWLSGPIYMNGGVETGSGSIVNRAGSVFDVQFDGQFIYAQNNGASDDGTDAAFTNQGTFVKSAGPGNISIQTVFNSQGALEVQSGELDLYHGGVQTGTILVAGGAVLAFEAGTHQLQNAAAISSAGVVRIGGSATVATTGVFNNGGELQITGGTLNAGDVINTATFSQSGGTLAGTGDVIVSGQSSLSGVAYMTGPGHLITRGALTIDGQVVLDGGRVIDVQGGADWLSGPIYMNGGVETGSGSIVNRAGSVFDVQFDGQTIYAQNNGASDDGTDAAFTNQGTFVKSAGPGSIAIQTIFNNQGALEVQSGELDLYTSGVQTGTILVAGGAVLAFEGGTHALANAAAITSSGVIRVGGAAIVNTTGVFNNGGELQIVGGTLNAGDVINTATFSQSGGTLAGIGDVIVSGQSTLSGVAYMTGPGHLITRGALTIDGHVALDAGRVIDVQDGAAWISGPIALNGGAESGSGSIVNRAGSIFDVQSDGLTIYSQNNGALDDGTDAVFINQGTFVKSSGTGSTHIQVAFENPGVLELQSGELDLYNASEHTGSINVLSGATLAFIGSTHELNNASAVNSTGRLLVAGATVNTTGALASGGLLEITAGTLVVGGDISTVSFAQSGGTLTGTGNVTVSGQTTFTSVSLLTGSGSLVTLGGLAIDGYVSMDAGRTLDIRGGATWSSGDILLNAGNDLGSAHVINRAGSTIDKIGSGQIATQYLGADDDGTDARFDNLGTFINDGGASTIFTAAVQNDGRMELRSGDVGATAEFVQNGVLSLAAGTEFRTYGNNLTNEETGLMEGAGTIELGGASLINHGVVAPGSTADPTATLTILGSFVQQATGVLEIDLQGRTAGQYDVLDVSQAVVLGGDFTANIGGGYNPDGSDSFDVILAGSGISGTFSGVSLPVDFAAQDQGHNYRLAYGGFACAGTICWDNSAGNNLWTDPLNWNTDVVPGITDTVVIDLGGGQFILLNGGNYTIATLQANEHLEISAGSLTVTGTSFFNAGLNLTGGTFAAQGGMAADLVEISSGNLTIVASANIAALNIAGGLVEGGGHLTVNSLSATGGSISLNALTGVLQIIQATGDLDVSIPVSTHLVDLALDGSATFSNAQNAIGVVRGDVGGNLSVTNSQHLQLGDGTSTGLVVDGNIVARSLAGSGQFVSDCVGDSCISIHGVIFAGGSISLYADDLFVAPSFDPSPGTLRTGLGDSLLNFVMWAPSTSGTDITLLPSDFQNIGTQMQTRRLIIGDPNDLGAIGQLNWNTIVLSSAELGSIESLEGYATDVDYVGTLGEFWNASYLATSVILKATNDLTIGGAIFASISLADGRNLTLVADAEGSGAGNLYFGGVANNGAHLEIANQGNLQEVLTLAGHDIFVGDWAGGYATIDQRGAGTTNFTAANDIQLVSNGLGVYLASEGGQVLRAGGNLLLQNNSATGSAEFRAFQGQDFEANSIRLVDTMGDRWVSVHAEGGTQRIHTTGSGVGGWGIALENLGGNDTQTYPTVSINANGGPQIIEVENSDGVLISGGGSGAQIGNFFGDQTLDIHGTGGNHLLIAAGISQAELFSRGTQSVNVGHLGESGSITVTGGSAAGAHGWFFAGGNQVVHTPGDIVLTGGNDNRVFIFANGDELASGTQDIAARSISITATAGAESTGIFNPAGTQEIHTTGVAGNGYGISVRNIGATGVDDAGFGAAAFITMRTGSQSIEVDQGGILVEGLLGGAVIAMEGGTSQTIDIVNGSLDLIAAQGPAFVYFAQGTSQTINADSIALSGGTANGAIAYIEAAHGTQSINVDGAITLIAGTAPGPLDAGPDNPPGFFGGESSNATIIARRGLQTIVADSLTLEAGSAGSENFANVRGDAGQDITLGTGGLHLAGGGGNGVHNFAVIENYGPSQVLNFAPGSSLVINGGAQGVRHYAGIWAGASVSYSYLVQANTPNEHTVSVTTTGSASQEILGDPNISLLGGASGGGTDATDVYHWRGNAAFIIAESGAQTVRATNIALGGGNGAGQNSASIVAFGGPANAVAVIQDIQALGTIIMEGGAAERTMVELTNRSTGIQSVVAESLTLEAGTGNFAFAEVKAGGTQNVTITGTGGALSLTGGIAGDDNYASVYNGAGRDQSISFQNGGSLNLTGGASGNRNGAFIKAGRNQTISGNVDILLHGGGGALAKAALEAAAIQRIGTSSVPVAGLELFGGSGLDAAAVVSAPTQEIWVSGDTTVGGGTGAGAFAIIGNASHATDLELNTGSLVLTGGPGTAGTATPYTAMAVVGALGANAANVEVVSAGNVTMTSSGASGALIGSQTGGGAVAVESTGGDIFTDTITLVAGSTVTMAAGGNLTVGIATARGGAVTLNSDGTLNLATALVSATGDINLQSETEVRVGSGSTFSPGGGDVIFDTPSLFLASNFTLPSSGWAPTFEREGMSIVGATVSTQLINQGTLTLENNAITAYLNNQGTINIASGVVSVTHGDGGSYTVASDATLEFSAGEYSLVSITGAGDVNVDGDVTLDTYSISGTTNLSGGYLTIEDSGSFGTLNMSGGTMDGTANLAATNLNLTGGTLGGTGDLIVTGNFNHAGGTLDSSFNNLSLRHVGTFTVGAYGAGNNLTLAAVGGALVINDVSLGATNVSLSGSSVMLAPSSATGSRVNATNLTVSTPGSLVVDGTHGEAKLFASNSVSINAGSVTVRAGSFSAGIDPATLTMNVDGNLVVQGGQGTQAVVAADNLNISAANILIEGGSIDGSYAGIIGGNGSSTIVALNGITLTPGIGLDSDAVIGSTGGPISLNTPSCSGCTILANDPIGNQALDTGLFGLPVTLTGPNLLPQIEVDNSIIYAATLAQDGGEANTEYKDDAEEDEDENSGVTEEGGNDGKPKRSLAICI